MKSVVGIHHVVRLAKYGPYDPSPLAFAWQGTLQDLAGGRTPVDPKAEESLIQRAVIETVRSLEAGEGVVAHCEGGTGRPGTVIACTPLGVCQGGVMSKVKCFQCMRGDCQQCARVGGPGAPAQMLCECPKHGRSRANPNPCLNCLVGVHAGCAHGPCTCPHGALTRIEADLRAAIEAVRLVYHEMEWVTWACAWLDGVRDPDAAAGAKVRAAPDPSATPVLFEIQRTPRVERTPDQLRAYADLVRRYAAQDVAVAAEAIAREDSDGVATARAALSSAQSLLEKAIDILEPTKK